MVTNYNEINPTQFKALQDKLIGSLKKNMQLTESITPPPPPNTHKKMLKSDCFRWVNKLEWLIIIKKCDYAFTAVLNRKCAHPPYPGKKLYSTIF